MKIIWSKKADTNYRKNLDYLQREWGFDVLFKFVNETDEYIKSR